MAVIGFQLPVPGAGSETGNRKPETVLLLVAGIALLLMGCAAPQYYACCLYGPASGDGACVLANGTEYATSGCDMEAKTCDVEIGGDEATLPVCSQVEQIKCNSSCTGMFCGRFDYDPRPPPEPVTTLDEGATPDELGGIADVGRYALYGAECRLLNMSSAVIRASSSTRGGFALNSFRFGVGNSFEDFEQATLYYPITDLGCQLNPAGEVDRYTNYAVPNRRMGSDEMLCGLDEASRQFQCTGNPEISSWSYYDCATRCMMDGAGYPASVDAFNPYLTYKDGALLGSPFSYGLSERYGTRDTPSLFPDATYRSRAMGAFAAAGIFNDNFYSGFSYYGADFAQGDAIDATTGLEWRLYESGKPEGEINDRYDYYYGEDSEVPLIKWGDDAIEMITIGRDPRPTYATLLSYHSVYGNQFRVGHYSKDGTWKPGAEFECLEARDCISSMCNKDFYSRGVCTNTHRPENDALCDCREEGDEIVCEGKQEYYTTPWDKPSATVRGTFTLSAQVVEFEYGAYGSFRQEDAPSKGKMVAADLEGGDGVDEKYIVIYLGGPDPYPDYSSSFYSSTYDDSDYSNATLTLDMVLSRDKWRSCDPAKGCGRFFTTFVDECFEDADGTGRSDFGLNYLAVCYGEPAEEITDEWGDEDIHGDPSRICDRIRGREEFFCYKEDANGQCELVAPAALVVEAREVDYTPPSPGGTATTVSRLAFGNCILDEDGEELEARAYGMCEPCSYLTIAKDRIVQLPGDKDEPGYEGEAGGDYPNSYCPLLSITTPYYFNPPRLSGGEELLAASAGKGFSVWESGGRDYHVIEQEPKDSRWTDSICSMPDGWGVGKWEAWPNYLPNAYYLREKIGDYEKRNVLPVIFADDSSLYNFQSEAGRGDKDMRLEFRYTTRTWIDYSSHPLISETGLKRLPLLDRYGLGYGFFPAPEGGGAVTGAFKLVGKYLADSVSNQGAAVVVVETDRMGNVLGPYVSDMLGSRSNAVKILCPNCMIAIGSGYYGYADRDYEEKMNSLLNTFWVENATTSRLIWNRPDQYNLSFTCNEGEITCDYLDGVDLIAEKWVIDGENGHCEMEDRSERFRKLLDERMEFGSKMLERFGKPIIITDFAIERGGGSCWTDEDAAAFMVFLGQHTADLVRSGNLGLIYSNWTTEKASDVDTGLRYNTPLGVLGERGEMFAGSFHASRYFSGFNKKSLISEMDVTEECQCVPCLPGDPDGICNGRFQGTGPACAGYEGGRVKWPDFCVSPDACVMGSDVGDYDIQCNIYYANGTEETKAYDGADVAANPQLHKDVISAIKNSGKVPCFTSTTRNLSYARLESSGFSAYAAIFRKDGNLEYSCSPTPETTICGYSPPFTDTQMDCLMAEKGSRISLPPLGERIAEGVGLPGGIPGGGLPGGGAGIPGGGMP
ncbi:MAG: hypothetical protein AB1657_01660 [Candidatus Micrarchaeota archaeon]